MRPWWRVNRWTKRIVWVAIRGLAARVEGGDIDVIRDDQDLSATETERASVELRQLLSTGDDVPVEIDAAQQWAKVEEELLNAWCRPDRLVEKITTTMPVGSANSADARGETTYLRPK